MMMEYVWINKKVYLETSSGRKYSGRVIEETDIKLVLIDFKNHIVEISKDDISICQEEE